MGLYVDRTIDMIRRDEKYIGYKWLTQKLQREFLRTLKLFWVIKRRVYYSCNRSFLEIVVILKFEKKFIHKISKYLTIMKKRIYFMQI